MHVHIMQANGASLRSFLENKVAFRFQERMFYKVLLLNSLPCPIHYCVLAETNYGFDKRKSITIMILCSDSVHSTAKVPNL